MPDEPGIPADMQRAMDVVGDERVFCQLLASLTRAMEFLEGHGWAKFGVLMRKGDHEVVLSLDGSVQASAASSDDEFPEEVRHLAGLGRPHDA